jgi:hypothetical protein
MPITTRGIDMIDDDEDAEKVPDILTRFLSWVLLFLCVASLLFLIVERLDRIGAIFSYFKKNKNGDWLGRTRCLSPFLFQALSYFKKEAEPCNTK